MEILATHRTAHAAVTVAVVLLAFVVAWWIADGAPPDGKGPAGQSSRS